MKKILVLLLAFALAIGAAGCKEGGSSEDPAAADLSIEAVDSWDEVALATWGNATLTLTDYMYFFRTTQFDTEQQVISDGSYTEDNIAEFWLYREEDGPSMEEMLKEQSLTDALHFSTLYQNAVEAGTKMEEGASQETIQAIDDTVAGLSEDLAAAAQLFFETYGLMPEQMKVIYEKMDLINQYLFEISVNSEISQEEINALYEADPGAFDQVTVRHVLILCDDKMTAEEQAAAKEKAEDVLARIEAGEEIGVLAAELSEDPGSKDNGGEYTFGKGEMVPPFEEWAFAASPGDRGIVKTDYGYHVMEMIKKLGLDELQNVIRNQIGDDKVNQVVEEAMATAKTQWEVDEEALGRISLA